MGSLISCQEKLKVGVEARNDNLLEVVLVLFFPPAFNIYPRILQHLPDPHLPPFQHT